MSEPIVRIASRGDGVTPSGRHVAFGVPGDTLEDDGRLIPGPEHRDAPCRHFPECGGCQLQHVSDAEYCRYLSARIEGALAQHELTTAIQEPHLSPPRARRRASLRALMAGGKCLIGFNAEKSNRIVDMRECHVLRPELFDLVAPLRRLLAQLMRAKRPAEIQMTLVDQGVDLILKGVQPEGLEAIEALTAFSEQHALARLSIDAGYGTEAHYEPRPATVTLAWQPVSFPPGSFLQATREGEAALTDAVLAATGDASRVADLFAGLGTFALALPGKVYAAEAARDAVASLKQARRSIAVEHRDLYRRPLDAGELSAFDAVVLDPPRAGAVEQVAALAGSAVPRIAYVSCNPATFARDARMLIDGGYRLDWVKPVGQFRWSTHVELAACFSR